MTTSSLADKFANLDHKGPTVADKQREQSKDALLQKLLTKLSEPQQVQAQSPQISIPAPQVVVQPAEPHKPVSWTFTFDRNPDGTILRVHATPQS